MMQATAAAVHLKCLGMRAWVWAWFDSWHWDAGVSQLTSSLLFGHYRHQMPTFRSAAQGIQDPPSMGTVDPPMSRTAQIGSTRLAVVAPEAG